MIGKLTVPSQEFRCAKRGLIQFGIYFTLALAFVACISPASPPEVIPSESPPPETEILVALATPSETLPPPTRTLTPASETPTKTAMPLIEIKSLIGPEELMLFDSWAPGSLWIAYWLAEDEEHPASLVFANVLSGETCQSEDVQAQSVGSDLLLWQEDGSVIVLPGGFPQGALKGFPCGAFAPAEDQTLPDPRTISTSLSPDGRYLAEEIIVQQEEAVFHLELTITELATGEPLLSMPYLSSPHFVSGGPKWLNNELYLIGMTVDQGVLYYSVAENRVGQGLPELLGLDAEQYVTLFTQTDPDAGTFHILVLSENAPLLYHSEFDQLEELPFANVGNFAGASSRSSFFSPDGKWLLLSQVAGGHYWLRPVDPPGSPPTQLAYYGQAGSLSRNGQSMAFIHGKRISIVSFPGGELLSQWHASGYDIQNIWWSPDGRRLIAVGHQSESNQTALFVIEP